VHNSNYIRFVRYNIRVFTVTVFVVIVDTRNTWHGCEVPGMIL